MGLKKAGAILFLVFMMMLGSMLPNPLAGSGKDSEGKTGSPYGLATPEAVPTPLRVKAAKDSPVPNEAKETRTLPVDEHTVGRGEALKDDGSTDTGKILAAEKADEKGKIDKPLSGKVICVDPGHQSVMIIKKVPVAPGESRTVWDYSIGTRGVETGVYEYAVALRVSKKLRTALEELGARVILTRERDDEPVGNIERAEIANAAKADAFIRIHCDGSDIPEARGISVLYPGSRYIDDNDMLEKSLTLSEFLLEEVVKATGAKNRGLYERNDQASFNYCKVPCTLIEMGFMTNPEEDRLLNSESYQDKLVLGMVNGILRYFNATGTGNNSG